MNDARSRMSASWPDESGVHAQTGRSALVLAAALGVAAIVGYGLMQTRERPTAQATATAVAQSSLVDLTARAAKARETLDVAALESVIGELDEYAATTTLAMKANQARLELLDTLAARALEATLRAQVVPDQERAAEREAAKAILRARELARGLEALQVDRGRVETALARVELAAGSDITESSPIVLMPTYRDPELRVAALSAPVWRADDEKLDPALLSEVSAELKHAERQTTLVRLLTAVTLERSGDAAGAIATIDGVLRATPQQPTALGLRRLVAPDEIVAVAETPAPPPEEPPRTTALVDEPPAEPVAKAEPPTKAEPAAKAEPTPTPAVEPSPVATPPATPTPEDEPVIDATPPASDPAPVAKPTPKPTADDADAKTTGKKKYKALLDEGCKLVRSGKASEGFEVLTQAFDLQPGAVAVTVCMAEAHHALGRDASARAMCDRALKKAPNDRRALLLAAELENARGNTAGALAHYKKILESHPDDAKAKAYVEAHGG